MHMVAISHGWIAALKSLPFLKGILCRLYQGILVDKVSRTSTRKHLKRHHRLLSCERDLWPTTLIVGLGRDKTSKWTSQRGNTLVSTHRTQPVGSVKLISRLPRCKGIVGIDAPGPPSESMSGPRINDSGRVLMTIMRQVGQGLDAGGLQVLGASRWASPE